MTNIDDISFRLVSPENYTVHLLEVEQPIGTFVRTSTAFRARFGDESWPFANQESSKAWFVHKIDGTDTWASE